MEYHSSPAAGRLTDVITELKEKRNHLHNLEKSIFALEKEKVVLEEASRADRLSHEQALQERLAREEKLRHESESRMREAQLELERMANKMDAQAKQFFEVQSSEQHLRLELARLQEKAIQDEKLIISAKERERQTHIELEKYQAQQSQDSMRLAQLEERERVLAHELERLKERFFNRECHECRNVMTCLPCAEPFPVVGVELSEGQTYGVDGVCVIAVKDGGPAAVAGIVEGDVLTNVNGHPVATRDDFKAVIRSCQPGQSLPFMLYRGQHPYRQKLMGQLTLAHAPQFPESRRTIVRRMSPPRGQSPGRTGVPLSPVTSPNTTAHSAQSPVFFKRGGI
eukprot:TRINITY_DN5685_c0_g1_i1.p1 TRINITY_DN5685_c0_g1~~TRINITY_DN5685_c0_g1_i1.p1  ORF type:complete len:340 (-),score=83.84 TRINITY_DN5685_c0_g1_i1:140-1159(-)